MRFIAKTRVELFGRRAVFGEGEIGMTKKFGRDRRLLSRIDEFGFQTGQPLHSGFFFRGKSNSAFHRRRAFHRAIEFIQPIGIGGEREN